MCTHQHNQDEHRTDLALSKLWILMPLWRRPSSNPSPCDPLCLLPCPGGLWSLPSFRGLSILSDWILVVQLSHRLHWSHRVIFKFKHFINSQIPLDFILTSQALREANSARIFANILLSLSCFQLEELPWLTVSHDLSTT